MGKVERYFFLERALEKATHQQLRCLADRVSAREIPRQIFCLKKNYVRIGVVKSTTEEDFAEYGRRWTIRSRDCLIVQIQDIYPQGMVVAGTYTIGKEGMIYKIRAGIRKIYEFDSSKPRIHR